MSSALQRVRPELLAIFFGLWAAAVALTPDLTIRACLLAPAIAVPVAIWTLASPGRWIALFLASALLLPPLPLAIGDSGPHPSLIFAALGVLAGALYVRFWRVHTEPP